MGIFEYLRDKIDEVYDYVKAIYEMINDIFPIIHAIRADMADIKSFIHNLKSADPDKSDISKTASSDAVGDVLSDEKVPDDLVSSPLVKFHDTLAVMTQQLSKSVLPLTDDRHVQSSFELLSENHFIWYMQHLDNKKDLSYIGDAYLFFVLYNLNPAIVSHKSSNAFICDRFKSYPLGYGSLESKADIVEGALGEALLNNYFPLEQIKLLFPASDRKLNELQELFYTRILPHFRRPPRLSANLKLKRSARGGWHME
jgi:hypothetical protein